MTKFVLWSCQMNYKANCCQDKRSEISMLTLMGLPLPVCFLGGAAQTQQCHLCLMFLRNMLVCGCLPLPGWAIPGKGKISVYNLSHLWKRNRFPNSQSGSRFLVYSHRSTKLSPTVVCHWIDNSSGVYLFAVGTPEDSAHRFANVNIQMRLEISFLVEAMLQMENSSVQWPSGKPHKINTEHPHYFVSHLRR